ncbi:MAG TPA: ABC transporter substrate-binding protein [Candidatus Acidoferrales bacterium]|nr:ABC transporter substrate-binding protein [Candidatus Acidoferrales bacterium]
MPLKRSLTIFIWFATLFFLVGHSEARSIKVSVPAQSISHMAFYTAQDKGFYREEGLDVDFILMNAPVALRALIGGDVDFTTVGGSGIAPILRGAPLRFFFVGFHRPIHWLYARPEIADIDALKGKKIANSGIGTPADIMVKRILRSHGLEAGKNLTIIYIGVLATRYAALASGAVDATPLTLPWNLKADEAGFRDLVNFTKQDLVEMTGTILAPDALFRSEPGLIEKFIRGTLKGLLYARDNRAGTIRVLANKFKVKEEMAGKMYDSSWPAMTVDGIVSKDAERRIVDEEMTRLGVKEVPPPDRVFNFSMVRKIRAELDAAGWKP